MSGKTTSSLPGVSLVILTDTLECSKDDVWRRNKHFDLQTVLLFSSKKQECLCVCACEKRKIILLFSMDKHFCDLYIKVFAWGSAW